MRRIYLYFLCTLFFLGLQSSTRAQDILIPAGTLLRCTIDEPNLSSATVSVGDPVVCNLRSFQEFGRVVFPRGSYLGGHVEAEKEPGHFVGKGYIKLEFDRIGLPSSDIPVPSKITAAKGFKVDKDGDILGHGHATRDVVEWMLPPLWPWKIITLPLRGPRPTLKGEELITLRLMDDVLIPRNAAAMDYYPNRPSPYNKQWSNRMQPSSQQTQPLNAPGVVGQANATGQLDGSMRTAAYLASSAVRTLPSTSDNQLMHLTVIALKSGETQGVKRYRVDNGVLNFVLPSGMGGSVDVNEVDWPKTLQLNTGNSALNAGTDSDSALN